MNRKESIEIAERELGEKSSPDLWKKDLNLECQYTIGYNKMRDKAKPLLADKIRLVDAWENIAKAERKKREVAKE